MPFRTNGVDLVSKGKFCLFVSAFLYGVMPVLADLAYDGGINGITLTFLRGFISLPVLIVIILISRRQLRLSILQLKRVALLGTIGGTLPVLTLYLSYNYISTGLATTLHFVYPLIIVLASAVIYKERISRVTLSAVVFVTVGIFMFTDINTVSNTAGIVLAVLSGVFYSFYVLYLDHSGLDRLDYIVLTFYVMCIISASTLVFGAFTNSLSFDISPASWLLSAVISLMTTLGAMPLFQIGVRAERASTAGILSTIEPVTSVILGAAFLGEPLGTGQLMGGAMILLGVLLTQKHHKKKRPAH